MTFSSYDLAGEDPNPMTVAEVDALKQLVKMDSLNFYNPVIINIGAERGTSTLAMLEERSDATIFSIDIAPCEGEFKNLIKAELDPTRVIRLLGRSQPVGHRWPFYIEFVWVDGDHRREGVLGDVAAWLPKISDGGIMAFHDYFEGEPPRHNPSGAGEAVREKMITKHELICEVERIRAFRI